LPVEQLPISRALRGEIGVNVEYRMRRIDINESWIGSFNFAPVRDQNNNIIGSVVTARDVTEQKNNLERLVESEARFRSLFEDNDSMFLLVDIQDGKIIDANWAAARFYGYSRETMQSMTILQLNGMSAAEIAPDLQAALKGTSKSFMRIHTLASGEKREMEALASVIEVNGRQVLFSVLRDVTEVKMAQKQLHQSEELYRTAFKTSLDAILITEEATGRIIDANNIFQEMVGHQDVYMQGKTTSELGLMVEKEDRQRILNRLRQEGSMRDFEFLFRRRNGEVRHGLMSASLIDIGGQRCIHSVIRDVTEEKLAAEKIRASEERYRTAFQTSIDAITITRMDDGRYLDVNQRFQEITEFARDEVLGKTSPELGLWVDKYDRDRFVDQIHEHAQCRDFQTRLRKKSGKLFWSLTSAAQIIINNERCILSVLRDVSDAKIAEEQIRNLAYFDPLTGLANRRMLIERLQHHPESEEAAQQYRALLLIDLNHFRGLNDAMGQPAGDVVLRETGMRLTSLMHNASLVARISGDAFAVELDGLGRTAQEAAAQAGAAATEIQSRIELPYQLEQRTWNLSCCIGIVVYAAHANDPHLILQQGDIALAQAKSAGRGSIRFFEVALQAAVEARAALEEELRQALINNEFELYYQPQLMYGNVIGAEALLRWNHPRHGLLTPGHFLPLAEENGLIYKLGEWVIESACKQLVQWSKSPLTSSLRLSINISSLDIRRKEFVQYILDTLERRGADPTRLQLEITESILMEDVSETIAKMHILKKRGLRFSIDDFGTGYSSLAYLKRFPIDELKIDISFVRDILVDNSSSTIAQAIISLGKAMDLVVVAEGVESEAQHEHLKQLGCRIFQGYFFGHPSPVQAFNDMLVRNSVLGAVN
jgi:diguanylate cyclase (GGDEF)-like protein/PAS domain S-box-containing protein